MRLWVMSDLHEEVTRYGWKPRERPDFDVLVVAGDVVEGEVAKGVDWVAAVADGRPSVMVLGNHEFWGRTREDVREEGARAAAAAGVTLLDGQGWVEVAGAAFAGCTLWTDMRLNVDALSAPAPGREIGEGIDVRGHGIDRRAKVRDLLRWHAADVASLEAALGATDLPDMPRVVVTHHAPHPLSCVPFWRARPGAAMSASDLSHLVGCGVADLWVHGHVHTSADYDLGGRTRVLCNPFGYHGNNDGFDEGLVVEVGGPAPSPLP